MLLASTPGLTNGGVLAHAHQTLFPATAPASQATTRGSDTFAIDTAGLLTQLQDATLLQSRRDETARRLLSRKGLPADDQVGRTLLAVLGNAGDRGGQLAVARGLASELTVTPDAVRPYAGALLGLLNNDKAVTEAAALALVVYASETTEGAGRGVGSGDIGKKELGSGSVPATAAVITRLLEAGSDPGRSDSCRAAVYRALGGIAERRVVTALVGVLQDDTAGETLHGAASDGLGDLTGHRDFGGEPRLWQSWLADRAGLDDHAFREELIARRSERLTHEMQKGDALSDELSTLLAQSYRLIPEERRMDRLQALLRHPQAAIRLAGVRIVRSDALEARPVPQVSREQIRTLLGDSSTEVRTEAAMTLRALNDTQALDALLAQLAHEPSAEVRAAIAGTLGPIRDRRAIEPLTALLSDDVRAVAQASAEALVSLGSEIRRDPRLRDRVIAALCSELKGRDAAAAGGSPAVAAGSESVVATYHASLIDALAALARTDEVDLIAPLAGPTQSARVRSAALRFLANLHEPSLAPTILAALGSDNADVRLEAVAALSAIPTFDHAEVLYQHLSAETEADSEVRSAAGAALGEKFELATREQLTTWVDRLAALPDQRLLALKALVAKLTAPGDEDVCARARELLGKTLLELDRPGEAVAPLRRALDAYTSPLSMPTPQALLPNGRPRSNSATRAKPVIVAGEGRRASPELYSALLDALLGSGQYAQAAALAGTAIADHPSSAGVIGRRLSQEAATLADSESSAAGPLLDALTPLAPLMPASYVQTLRELRVSLQPPAASATRPTTTAADRSPPASLPATRASSTPLRLSGTVGRR